MLRFEMLPQKGYKFSCHEQKFLVWKAYFLAAHDKLSPKTKKQNENIRKPKKQHLKLLKNHYFLKEDVTELKIKKIQKF